MSGVDTTRLRAELEALVADLLTQDNAATADPYYTVQQQVRDWGFEEGYGEDGSVWIFDGEEVDPDAWLEDTGEPFDTEAPPDGAREVTYRYRWEHVQAFLTQDAALAFMELEKHNHGPMRTWVESACRNPQMRQLRELPAQALALLDDLAAARTALGEGWLAGGVTLAEGIERKTRALERSIHDQARLLEARDAATAPEQANCDSCKGTGAVLGYRCRRCRPPELTPADPMLPTVAVPRDLVEAIVEDLREGLAVERETGEALAELLEGGAA